MGTCYKGACHDCCEYIYLDHFYSFCLSPCQVDFGQEDLDDYDVDFIYHALRLHMFMGHHRGHRIGVYPDTDPDNEISDYTEVFGPPPQQRQPDYY